MRTSLEESQRNEAPWSASTLPEDIEFFCRDCQAVLITKGSVKTWKDLPSENWAEMMDFWHCHKPDVPHTHDSSDQNANRGYGTNMKFAASNGTGFVDLITLLLTASECPGVQVRINSSLPILCLGIKKVAMLCVSCSVVWSPIQVPKNNTFCPFHNNQLAYPLLPIMGCMLIGGYKPRRTPYLPQELKGHGIKTRDISLVTETSRRMD
jgi:hypothetical protein